MNLSSGDLRAIADALERIDDMGNLTVRQIEVQGWTVILAPHYQSEDKGAFDHRVVAIKGKEREW